MILLILADGTMRGDHVGDYGPWGGVVGFIAIALFCYVIAGGRTGRGPRK